MASLTRDEVQEIALLARLHLGDEEIERLRTELGAILGHIQALSGVDTTGIEPMTHAVPLDCPLRPDQVGDSLPADQAVGAAARRDGDFFEVPRIIESAEERR